MALTHDRIVIIPGVGILVDCSPLDAEVDLVFHDMRLLIVLRIADIAGPLRQDYLLSLVELLERLRLDILRHYSFFVLGK